MSTANPYEAPKAEPPRPDPERSARRDATWAIVLGTISLFFCAPITAPLAIWKAVVASRTHTFGRAVAAIVFAIIGLLSSAFLWFLAIWQILSPGK